MSESSKPTPGPWSRGYSRAGKYCVWLGGIEPEATMGGDETWIDCNTEANARLIAEAGTVFHETGLTPRGLWDLLQVILKADESDNARGGEMYYAEVLGEAVRDVRAALANTERKT